MSNVTSSQTNITDGQQFRGLVELLLFSAPITLSCCVFLFINCTMFFTLRSKLLFRETSRYILLYNLLFADTAQMALSQVLYILSACRVMLTYPVCAVLTMLCVLAKDVSPLTLVLMSLERYVAVCYPLRHTAIITIRNTEVAIVVVWAVSSLNVLIQVLLLLEFLELENLQMKELCSIENMLLGPVYKDYDQVYTFCLFVSAGVAVTSSYIGVMVAARSASTDKASARKARNTLLLHLVQLGLSLSSTIYSPLVFSLTKLVDRKTILRIQSILYVCVILLPRCLSTLIYGIRDQNIRPILIGHLCCRYKLSVVLTAKVSV
ncbi:odorant receptor 131-2-like [Chaetodon trifascialis]|uniref:odorant receptor 131-2-like n=1 Tax=Chaetodon trifascialis TaxID=109706 RepID=UPI0039910CD2